MRLHLLSKFWKFWHSDVKYVVKISLKIKNDFGYENYLSIIKNFGQRRRLSKLRISAHKLQIEIGRYQGIPNSVVLQFYCIYI
jgi:hypothetical protein